MALLNTIRKVAVSAAETGVPAALLFGEVTKESPPAVEVEGRFEISGEALVISSDMTAFAVGDKLALLRNYGGQRFYVLGRV